MCIMYWANGEHNGNYHNGLYKDYRVDIGVILNCELNWRYIGIMENKMETLRSFHSKDN